MVELQRGMVGEHGYVFLLEPRPFASGSKTPDFANTIPAFLAIMAVAFTFFDFPLLPWLGKGERKGGGLAEEGGGANNVCALNVKRSPLARLKLRLCPNDHG